MNFTKPEKNSKVLILIILWILISQLSTTIYLPSLPSISIYFKNSIPSQYIFTSYILAYGISQFIYGPLSDWYGRKKIILISLFLSLAGSLLAFLSQTMHFLILSCFILGLGTGGLGVLARIAITDHYSSEDFRRISSYLSMAFAISPLLGSIIGGLLQEFFSWRNNFILISLLSFLAFMITNKFYPKLEPIFDINKTIPRVFFKNCLLIFTDKLFLIYMSCGLLGMAAETSYEIAAPFLLQQDLGLTPMMYGIVNVIPLLGYLLGSFLVGRLSEKIHLSRTISISSVFISLGGLLMLILNWYNLFNLYTVILSITLSMIGLGVVFPCSMAGILLPLRSMAGFAGALSAGTQNLAGVFMSAIVINFSKNQQNFIASIFIYAGCLIFLLANLHKRTKPALNT